MKNIFASVGFHRPALAAAKYSYRNYLFPYKTDYIYWIIKDNLALHPGLVRIFWVPRHAREAVMKKIVLIIIVLLIASNSWAVVVTGSGSTKEEAIGNGLREAVEMYTGALVYGVTDVENYQVRKDQIVAASLGHVKKYRIIRTLKIDDLALVTLDVNLSEDKIERIVRDNVHLITYEDVLRDFNNVTQRQDQIRKLMDMMRILASRPVGEKYGVLYEGYEIKRISVNHVDVILKARVTLNPFYSRAYNEILKNLSEREGSSKTWGVGGNYRIESGRLTNDQYHIAYDIEASTIDDVRAQIHVNGMPVDQCRKYRDNLMVVYSPAGFAGAFVKGFPRAFKQAWNEEPVTVDEKYTNAGIRKSKILPPEGLPLKIKYRINDSKDIKTLWTLKLTMDNCAEGQ